MGNTHRETESMRSLPEGATEFPVDALLIASTHRAPPIENTPKARRRPTFARPLLVTPRFTPNNSGPAPDIESPRSNASRQYSPPHPDLQSSAPPSGSCRAPAPTAPASRSRSPAASLHPPKSHTLFESSSASSARCSTCSSPSDTALPVAPVRPSRARESTPNLPKAPEHAAPCTSPPAPRSEYPRDPAAAPKSSTRISGSSAACSDTPASDLQNIRTDTDSSPPPA